MSENPTLSAFLEILKFKKTHIKTGTYDDRETWHEKWKIILGSTIYLQIQRRIKNEK